MTEDTIDFRTPPVPIQTGSLVLDQLLKRSNLLTGRVLHLFGSREDWQSDITLGMCRAACKRGERAYYFNLGEPLAPDKIERHELTHFADQTKWPKWKEPFRILTSDAETDVKKLIKAVAMSESANGRRLTIIVDSLERAFESPLQPLSESLAHSALDTLQGWVDEFTPLIQQTGTLVWLCHSSDRNALPFNRPGVGERPAIHYEFYHDSKGRIQKRKPSKKNQAIPDTRTPFQRGVLPLLMQAGPKHLPPYGLEVSPLYVTTTGATKREVQFEHQVQLWKGDEPRGEFEWLTTDRAEKCGATSKVWTPRSARPTSYNRSVKRITISELT